LRPIRALRSVEDLNGGFAYDPGRAEALTVNVP
jgi:hypothetical protein